MVNLRYHIVSLVAVFLALAIGVVLGAGPLQNQVNMANRGADAQQRVQQLETQVEAADSLNSQYELFVNDLSADVIPGTLRGVDVALIAVAGADADEIEQISAALQQAGATVTGTVELTTNWTSQAQREYRETLSAPLSTHLAEIPAVESADMVLAQGLMEVISLSGPEVDLVKEILSDGATPLIEQGTIPAKTAQAAVLVGPATPLVLADDDADQETDEPNAPVSMKAIVALANTAGTLPRGAVAVGAAADQSDFISQLRDSAVSISTVDQLGTPLAPINVALALASGTVGSYGQGIGAAAPVAPVPGR